MKHLIPVLLLTFHAESAELLHLSFDNDFVTDEALVDSSGSGNHFVRYGEPGVPGSVWNFPVPIARTNASGELVSQAGAFTYRTNVAYGIYNKLGDYAGTENIAPFEGLATATVSAWIHYNRNIVNPDSYLGEHTATTISAGQTENGSWILGRDSSHFTKFAIKTPAGSARIGPGFPDFVQNTAGETDGWHHYVATFDNGVARTYYDGVFYEEVVTSQPVLNVGGTWIAVGCQTHNGTPQLEDEGSAGPNGDFPNHAWLNGGADEIHVWNTVLTDTEIAALYSSESVSCPSCPPPPPPVDPIIEYLSQLVGHTVTNVVKDLDGNYALEFENGFRTKPVQNLTIE